jgi:hypothetical protein
MTARLGSADVAFIGSVIVSKCHNPFPEACSAGDDPSDVPSAGDATAGADAEVSAGVPSNTISPCPITKTRCEIVSAMMSFRSTSKIATPRRAICSSNSTTCRGARAPIRGPK